METLEAVEQEECLDIEALPSGLNQVNTTVQRNSHRFFVQVVVEAVVHPGEDEDEESKVSFLPYKMPSYPRM